MRDGFSYVFRLNPDSRVSQVKVTTGRRLGERLEVVQGIDAATLVASIITVEARHEAALLVSATGSVDSVATGF